jgi:acyl carrier protein
MYEFAEPRIRRVVADHLGVGTEELAPDISLTDDLAVDSLDLVELALALESEFGIDVPERLLDEVRTYGDLVDATLMLARVRTGRDVAARIEPSVVWSRVIPAGEGTNRNLERAGALTPYAAQEIAEDALRAGRGARLEVSVPPGTNDAGVAWVQNQFAWLGNRGVNVVVHRDYQAVAQRPTSPHAAA